MNIKIILKLFIQMEFYHGKVGDFATCCQTWIGNESSFFCCHFLASSRADVEKQITSWGIDFLVL